MEPRGRNNTSVTDAFRRRLHLRSLPLISLVASLALPSAAYAQDSAIVVSDDNDDPLEVQGDEIIVTAPRIIGQIDAPQKPI